MKSPKASRQCRSNQSPLVKGAAPVVIVGLSLASLALTLRFADTTWRRQLAIGVPITAALVGIAALLVDGFAIIPYQFPNSYYLWVGLVVLAVVMGAIGWRRFRNWRRVVSVVSVVLTTATAMTLVNQHYQYYPTVGTVLGVDAQNQVAADKLEDIRQQYNGVLPSHGVTVQVAIPGTVSGFKARHAEVWLPPAWIANRNIHLPVIELLAGVPGGPLDWTRAGFADQTAEKFANAHHGVAPIIVMPDANGSATGDTECVNSKRGQAETYLTVDVPRFVRKTYGAETSPGSMAIAGLSAGGMCSLMLALRHPDLYSTFADYAGLTSPTVGESIEPNETTQQLFDDCLPLRRTRSAGAVGPPNVYRPGRLV